MVIIRRYVIRQSTLLHPTGCTFHNPYSNAALTQTQTLGRPIRAPLALRRPWKRVVMFLEGFRRVGSIIWKTTGLDDDLCMFLCQTDSNTQNLCFFYFISNYTRNTMLWLTRNSLFFINGSYFIFVHILQENCGKCCCLACGLQCSVMKI